MTQLETLVRIGLAELADEVRTVDLTARVAATRRRRRTRNRFVAFGAAAAVAASSVGAVALWPEPAPDSPPEATTRGPSLPSELDLTDTRAARPTDTYRLLLQIVDQYGTVRSYGVMTDSDEVVALPHLPKTPELTGMGISLEPPGQLSADGSRLLVQPTLEDNVPYDAVPRLVDTRTGLTVRVPWQDEYRTAGLAPDGRSLAITTLPVMAEPCGTQDNPCSGPDEEPAFAPWGLAIMDLTTGSTRAVDLPATLDLTGSSTYQYAWLPSWAPDGGAVEFGMATSTGMLRHAVASFDDGAAAILADPPAAAAPWSPDGNRLLVQGASTNAYRVVAADPAAENFGAILDAGPVSGRLLLGWSSVDRLLWYDSDLGALIETDLSGTPVAPPTSLVADGQVVSVLVAPSKSP